MAELVKEAYPDDQICLKSLVDAEFRIVSFLEFDLQVQTPLTFLGRYLMFFITHDTKRTTKKTVEQVANKFLENMAQKSVFLQFLPAVQAAAVTVLTVNLFNCEAAILLKLVRSADDLLGEKKSASPLEIWTPEIEKLTKID